MNKLEAGQKPVIMPHYPHMMYEDVLVWTKFLESNGKRLRQVWYDMHLGAPVEVPEGASEVLRKVAAGLTRKRVDVVCEVAEGYWVVEIKPFCNMLAMGQALTYAWLFRQEYKVDGEIWPVVVCDKADEDLAGLVRQLRVVVFKND